MERQALWVVVSLFANVVACASGVEDLGVEGGDDARDDKGHAIHNESDATKPSAGSSKGKDAGQAVQEQDASSQGASNNVPPPSSQSGTGVKRVFITAGKYTGNVGGVNGADFKCAVAAQSANLGGSFKAWISDSVEDAPDRIYGTGPWYAVDGTTKMFDDKAGLSGPSLSDQWLDENGFLNSAPFAWTATLKGTKTTPTCGDWTTSSGDGKRTLLTLGVTVTNPCNGPTALLCVED